MTNFYRVEDTYADTQTPQFQSLRKACEYAFEHRDVNTVLGNLWEHTLVTMNDNFNLEYAESFDNFEDFYNACAKLSATRK